MNREVNIPLLRKAVEWAEAEAAKPAELCEWEQSYWAIPTGRVLPQWLARKRQNKAPECGTLYCIAGYVCEMAGVDAQGRWASVAAEALGLGSFAEVDASSLPLFDANNSIEDVRRIAEDIAGERL